MASGGELALSCHLAILVICGDAAMPTLVFDEVDVGSAAGAAQVGRKLQTLDDWQVLCVTHMPQVAAHADHHCNGAARTATYARSTRHRIPMLAKARQPRSHECWNVAPCSGWAACHRENGGELLDSSRQQLITC